MKIETRFFGKQEILDDKIIYFEEGIPGFESLHKFAYIDSEEGPFNYLQSIEQKEVCFIIADPHEIMPDYAPTINESYFEKLGGGENEDFGMFGVVVLKKEFKESTINLAGPILINKKTKKAVQVITEEKKYTTKYKFAECISVEEGLIC